MAVCSSCGAAILFVRTRKRALMPIDANLPVENAVDADPTATFEDLRDRLGADVVQAHFAQCPDADRHRRRR